MEYKTKSKKQLLEELNALRNRLRKLKRLERRWIKSQDDLKRRTWELRERVKELNCLYGVSHLVEKHNVSLEEILQGTVNLIPSAWLYPEAACARIVVEDLEFRTENFRETIWQQKSDITAYGDRIGFLEVYYLVEKSESDEGPFLKGERHLINAVAERLGHIIERVRAEEALRQSEERLNDLFENASDIIYTHDLEGRFTSVNSVGRRKYGYSPEEVSGVDITEIVSPEYLPSVQQRLQEKLNGSPWSSPYELLTFSKDGRPIWVEVSTRLIKKNGQPVEVHGIARDITDFKKAREQLLDYQMRLRSMTSKLALSEQRERRRLAVCLHDSVGQFLALAKIKLRDLQESVPSASLLDPLDEVWELINQAAENTRLLTADLSPRILYELGLNQALEWLCEKTSRDYAISTEFQGDSELKELDEDIQILLYMAIRELLINVVKHANAQKAKVFIRRGQDKVLLTVEDDGVGFDSSKPYYYDAKVQGLGLFSIRERIEYFGGCFEIESEPGEGTKISLSLELRSNRKF